MADEVKHIPERTFRQLAAPIDHQPIVIAGRLGHFPWRIVQRHRKGVTQPHRTVVLLFVVAWLVDLVTEGVTALRIVYFRCSGINRRAAAYVAKVLRGAKAAELPIEQAERWRLVINLKTANALGLSIPTALLATADEVIE